MKAVVYDVNRRQVILSQTSPVLSPSHVGESVNLSFISSAGHHPRRIGVSAVVCRIVTNYELNSGTCVSAVILERKTEPREVNLRRHFRVKLFADSGIDLTIDAKSYTLLDLSLTGLRFEQPLWQNAFRPADRIRLRLDFNGKGIYLTSNVVRVSSTMKSRSIAVMFSELTDECEANLWKAIFQIDRKNTCRQSKL